MARVKITSILSILFFMFAGFAAEIPAIVYSLDPATPENFRLARELGFNTVHSYGLGRPERRANDLAYLKLAREHGLNVMFNLNGKYWTADDKTPEQFRAYVRQFKDQPVISLWYLYDEPPIGKIPQLRKLYRVLKDETPEIPVAIAMNWTEDFTSYSGVYDIILPDVYPVTDQPFPNAPLYGLLDMSRDLLALGKPVFPVAQLFNWRVLREQVPARGADPDKCRFPNTAELRYWLYGSAVQGCDGIAFWSFYRCLEKERTEGLAWLKDTFAPVLREYLAWRGNGFSRHMELKRFHDSRLLGMVCRTADAEYLILINDWPLPQNVRNRWLEEQIGEAVLTPFGATRNLPAEVSGGRLKIDGTVEPWETLVWKVERKNK